MTKYPNREALRKAHDIYRDAMRSFIIRCLRKVQGERVEDLIQDALSYEEVEHNGNIEAAIDINHFPHIIRKYWNRARGFSQQFNSNSKIQSKTGVIADGRNLWAHPGVEDLDAERTRADLTYVAEVLGEIKNQDAKREVEDIRDRLFSHKEEEHTADVSDQLEVVRAENTELKKQLNTLFLFFITTSSRLEEMETEWIASEERLTDMSNLLKSVEAENADLKKRLLEKENRLQTVESESNERIKTLASTRKVSEPKPSIAEKFRAANTLYEYEGEPLNTPIIRSILNTSYPWQGSLPVSAILEVLTQYHLERGGIPTQLRDFRTHTYDILCEMEAEGQAKRYREGNKDYWQLI